MPANNKNKTIESHEPAAVFDCQAFAERTAGDKALMREITDIFLQETRERICKLSQAIKKQYQEDAVRLAHTIKGSSANVGGNKLNAIVRKIGNACKAAEWREAELLTPRLNKQLEILERAMRDFLKSLS